MHMKTFTNSQHIDAAIEIISHVHAKREEAWGGWDDETQNALDRDMRLAELHLKAAEIKRCT